MKDPRTLKENFYHYFIHAGQPSRQEIFGAREVLDYYNYIVDLQQESNAVTDAVARFPDMEIYAASALALVCGGWVEAGGDPGAGFDGLLQLLARAIEKVFPYAAHKPYEEEDDDAAAKERWEEILAATAASTEQQKEEKKGYIQALDLLVLPVMAMLMRSAENRNTYRNDALHVKERLEYIYHADNLEFDNLIYLYHAYELSDIDSLFVVFPKQKTGMEVAVHAVNNNFHLFTLLQQLIAEEGEYYGLPEGACAPEGVDFHAGSFHWLSAYAYRGGRLSDPMAMAWGEAPVYDNPKKNGQYLVLADEKIMDRSWGAAFCTAWHGSQNAHVHFKRMLTLSEVEACLA